MSQPDSFGDTISSGIQDISALLPLLGTEQCERHVGAALENGYLYASASPLSIFGSLGIVKTAFATFLGTTTSPFNGGSWLHDAGFGTTGSVASMVTIVPGTKRYGAEVRLQQLMKDQHIDDPEMVSDIELVAAQRQKKFTNISWNWSLVLTSTLTSLVSISPYIYLASNIRGTSLLSWLFPSLRALGSLLCVVSVQFALQRRIHHIARGSLLLAKARKGNDLTIEEATQDTKELLEVRLQKILDEMGKHQHLRKFRATKPATDPENGGQAVPYQDGIAAELRLDIRLLFLQVLMLLGMGMIVAGYVGCFNLVSRTEAESGPYIWLGMESFLSILRIILWGSNPSWDERNTGMVMHLNLLSQSHTPSDISSILLTSKAEKSVTPTTSSSPGTHLPSDKLKQPIVNPPTSSCFPLITTSHRLWGDLATDSRLPWEGDTQGFRDSFVVHEKEDFLSAATPYVGPLRRLELNSDVSIYYAVVPDAPNPDGSYNPRRYLCVTARPHGSLDSVSIFMGGEGKTKARWDDDETYHGFVSHPRDIASASALQVVLGASIRPSEITSIDERTLRLILEYSEHLHSRLFPKNPDPNLLLSWTFATPPMVASISERTSVPLTSADKEYMRLGQLSDFKGDLIMAWGTSRISGLFPRCDIPFALYNRREFGLLFVSGMLEIYLCILDRRFVKDIGASPEFSNLLALEWIQGMDRRISMEAESSRQRMMQLQLPAWARDDASGYFQTTRSLARDLRSLRLSQDTSLLQKWEDHMKTITGSDSTSGEPPLSDLLTLYPLREWDRLTTSLKNVYREEPQTYQGLLSVIRDSIHLLHSNERPAFGRIDPVGPGSLEFSPPCTFIRTSFDSTLKALEKQINSVQILALNQIRAGAGEVQKVLDLLESLSVSPPALTTLVFTNHKFELRDCNTLSSILDKHTDITCLVIDHCNYGLPNDEMEPFVTQWHKSLRFNRRKWGRDALARGEFRYQVGITGFVVRRVTLESEELVENHCFRKDSQDDIWMPDTLEVQVLVHFARHGKMIPVFSCKIWDHTIILDAQLLITREDNDDDLSMEKPGYTEELSLSRSTHDLQSASVHGIRELGVGCYQLNIRVKRMDAPSRHPYSFNDLTVKFTPTPSPSEKNLTQTTGKTESSGVETQTTKDSANGTQESTAERSESANPSIEEPSHSTS
ncbi:hypothetical protein V5O48_010043 [Marasmius crinis-equi]|uniref:Uncharacterized protein n=1 Tax=Marasmius crinis-equi TaxID=585013 RepID=A0ABR3F9H5_9AGAR